MSPRSYARVDGAVADASWWPRRKLVKLITSRTTEALARPKALSEFALTLSQASTFLASARANETQYATDGLPARFTTEELDKFEKMFREKGIWVDEAKRKQDKIKEGHLDPAFRVQEVEKRAQEIDEERRRLERRKVPRRKKVLPTKSAKKEEEGEESKTASAEGERASEGAKEKVKDEL